MRITENEKKYINYDGKIENSKTKTELANELGINAPKDGYWGDMPSSVCGTIGGAIGGNNVKAAIIEYEKNLAYKPNIE